MLAARGRCETFRNRYMSPRRTAANDGGIVSSLTKQPTPNYLKASAETNVGRTCRIGPRQCRREGRRELRELVQGLRLACFECLEDRESLSGRVTDCRRRGEVGSKWF